MTRKRTVALAVLEIPTEMAKAALACLTPDQLQALTPTQVANVHQLCSTCARGIAFILENPQSRIVGEGTQARVEPVPERERTDG